MYCSDCHVPSLCLLGSIFLLLSPVVVVRAGVTVRCLLTTCRVLDYPRGLCFVASPNYYPRAWCSWDGPTLEAHGRLYRNTEYYYY